MFETKADIEKVNIGFSIATIVFFICNSLFSLLVFCSCMYGLIEERELGTPKTTVARLFAEIMKENRELLHIINDIKVP